MDYRYRYGSLGNSSTASGSSGPGGINQTHGGEGRGIGKGWGLCRGVSGGVGHGGIAIARSSNI